MTMRGLVSCGGAMALRCHARAVVGLSASTGRLVCARRLPSFNSFGASRTPVRLFATQRFPVPSMGDSISEGTILEFHKRPGQYIGMEEVIASVETDKVTVEVRSPAAGTITQLFAAEGDNVEVGGDLMEIDVGAGSPETETSSESGSGASDSSTDSTPAAEDASGGPAASPASSSRVHLSGNPSLIQFRHPMGAEQQDASAPAAPAASAAPPPAPSPAPAPTPPKAEKPSKGPVIDEADLPARFRRLPMSEEEMDAVMMGGAGHLCN